MCGILGILGLQSGGADTLRPTVLSLAKLLRHRGPDWNGFHCGAHAILAHERLSIVGVASGAQPITRLNPESGKHSSLTVNGEIYNYEDLQQRYVKKEDLMGTNSDCEVREVIWSLTDCTSVKTHSFIEHRYFCTYFTVMVPTSLTSI